MKRLVLASLALCAVLLANSAQASLWTWSFDAELEGTVSGTLVTTTSGYGSGIYTIGQFTVTDDGGTALFEGDYALTPSLDRFTWDDSIQDYSNVSINATVLLNLVQAIGPTNTIVSYKDGDDIVDRGFNFAIAPAPVPIPAAAWLFMSGLIGLVWEGRKARQSVA